MAIADGGTLLWSCNWSCNELFHKIYENYVQLCFKLKYKTPVFNGYTPSTKDAWRHGRSGKVSQLVEIHDENRWH